MKVDTLLNGHITLILTPENDAEKEILKALVKQDNQISELRSTVTVLSKSISNGIMITKKPSIIIKSDTKSEEKNDDKEEALSEVS